MKRCVIVEFTSVYSLYFLIIISSSFFIMHISCNNINNNNKINTVNEIAIDDQTFHLVHTTIEKVMVSDRRGEDLKQPLLVKTESLECKNHDCMWYGAQVLLEDTGNKKFRIRATFHTHDEPIVISSTQSPFSVYFISGIHKKIAVLPSDTLLIGPHNRFIIVPHSFPLNHNTFEFQTKSYGKWTLSETTQDLRTPLPEFLSLKSKIKFNNNPSISLVVSTFALVFLFIYYTNWRC